MKALQWLAAPAALAASLLVPAAGHAQAIGVGFGAPSVYVDPGAPAYVPQAPYYSAPYYYNGWAPRPYYGAGPVVVGPRFYGGYGGGWHGDGWRGGYGGGWRGGYGGGFHGGYGGGGRGFGGGHGGGRR